MNKVPELTSSPGFLPIPQYPTQTQAQLKVKVLRSILPLCVGHSHRHTFYLTIDWPVSLPSASHIPQHPPTPILPLPTRAEEA